MAEDRQWQLLWLYNWNRSPLVLSCSFYQCSGAGHLSLPCSEQPYIMGWEEHSQGDTTSDSLSLLPPEVIKVFLYTHHHSVELYYGISIQASISPGVGQSCLGSKCSKNTYSALVWQKSRIEIKLQGDFRVKALTILHDNCRFTWTHIAMKD